MPVGSVDMSSGPQIFRLNTPKPYTPTFETHTTGTPGHQDTAALQDCARDLASRAGPVLPWQFYLCAHRQSVWRSEKNLPLLGRAAHSSRWYSLRSGAVVARSDATSDAVDRDA